MMPREQKWRDETENKVNRQKTAQNLCAFPGQ